MPRTGTSIHKALPPLGCGTRTSVSMLGPVSIVHSGHLMKTRKLAFILDPENGIQMKIWQCFNGLAAQTWSFDNNHHFVLQGKGMLSFVSYRYSTQRCARWLGQCLDLTNGITTNGNPVQTWQCVSDNQNQVWVPVNNA
jgi:hypothetical protein